MFSQSLVIDIFDYNRKKRIIYKIDILQKHILDGADS